MSDAFIRGFDAVRDWQAFETLNFETFFNSIPANEAVDRAEFRKHHQWLMERYDPKDVRRNAITVATNRDDAYLGHCWMGVQNDFFTNRPLAWIYDLSVVSVARRLGIGTMLLEDVRHRAKSLGFESLGLQVLSHNEEAIRFYERHGLGFKAHSMIVDL